MPEKIYKKRGSYLDKYSRDIEMDGRRKIPQAGENLSSDRNDNNGEYG